MNDLCINIIRRSSRGEQDYERDTVDISFTISSHSYWAFSAPSPGYSKARQNVVFLHVGDDLSGLLDGLHRLVLVHTQACAAQWVEGDPLRETERPGDVCGGASLGLQVAGHGEVVVLSNLEVVVVVVVVVISVVVLVVVVPC